MSIGCGVSLCTMTAISGDRFLALLYHMRYPNLMTERRDLRSSAAVWFMCVLISCLRLFKNVSAVLAVASIALCICISTFSAYIRIYQIVRQHQLKIHDQQQVVQSLNADPATQSGHPAFEEKCYKYIYILYLYDCVLFSNVYLHLNCCYQPQTPFRDLDLSKYYCIPEFNSPVNPIIYCWRLRKLRVAALNTSRNMLCQQKEEN